MSLLATVSRFIPPGLGWQRDLPDPRDYTPEHHEVSSLLSDLALDDSSLPASVDHREDDEGVYLSPPDDQGRLNSSSAFACLALVEYFERRTLGRTFEGSALFLYEMARKLAGATGNTGIGIRTTLKALRRYGAPPEEMRPYSDQCVIEDPGDVSLLGFSRELERMVYFRLDTPNCEGSKKLVVLKSFLAAGFPVAFGFIVPRSATRNGVIPFRPTFDSYRGGQTVLAVGYNDKRLPGKKGAVLIRSSWGPCWGEAGCGWLPYSFVTHGQTADFWTIFSSDWADSKELRSPHSHSHKGNTP